APMIKAELASSVELSLPVRWYMTNYIFSGDGYTKESPDGIDWSDEWEYFRGTQPSREFYSVGDNILSWTGSPSFVSTDRGATWTTVTGTVSNGLGHQRAVVLGGTWFIASSAFGSLTITNGTVTNLGWAADGICELNGSLFAINNRAVVARDGGGALIWSQTY